jgi:hypothetical protein
MKDLIRVKFGSLGKVVPPLITDNPFAGGFISIVSIVMSMTKRPKAHLRIGPACFPRKIRCKSRRQRAIAMLWMSRTWIGCDRAVVCKDGNFSFWFRSCNLCNLAIEPFQICFVTADVIFNVPIGDIIKVVYSKADTLFIFFGNVRPKGTSQDCNVCRNIVSSLI